MVSDATRSVTTSLTRAVFAGIWAWTADIVVMNGFSFGRGLICRWWWYMSAVVMLPRITNESRKCAVDVKQLGHRLDKLSINDYKMVSLMTATSHELLSRSICAKRRHSSSDKALSNVSRRFPNCCRLSCHVAWRPSIVLGNVQINRARDLRHC